MWVFMAGTTMRQPVNGSTVLVSMSSAMPWAILAITSAVAGATTSASASAARAMWWMTEGSARSNTSSKTRRCVRASNVTGATNCSAAFVIITCTAQPRFVSAEASDAIL